MKKRLYKGKNRMISGVCSGIAEYCNIDPTLIRLLVAFLTIAGCGSGIIVYIIAAVIMPDRETAEETEKSGVAHEDVTGK